MGFEIIRKIEIPKYIFQKYLHASTETRYLALVERGG